MVYVNSVGDENDVGDDFRVRLVLVFLLMELVILIVLMLSFGMVVMLYLGLSIRTTGCVNERLPLVGPLC